MKNIILKLIFLLATVKISSAGPEESFEALHGLWQDLIQTPGFPPSIINNIVTLLNILIIELSFSTIVPPYEMLATSFPEPTVEGFGSVFEIMVGVTAYALAEPGLPQSATDQINAFQQANQVILDVLIPPATTLAPLTTKGLSLCPICIYSSIEFLVINWRILKTSNPGVYGFCAASYIKKETPPTISAKLCCCAPL